MPSWLRARIARHEAKAFAGDSSGIISDSDVVTTASAQGMQNPRAGSGQQHGVGHQFQWFQIRPQPDRPGGGAARRPGQHLQISRSWLHCHRLRVPFFSSAFAPTRRATAQRRRLARSLVGRPEPHRPRHLPGNHGIPLHPTPQFDSRLASAGPVGAPAMASRAAACPRPPCTSPRWMLAWAHC